LIGFNSCFLNLLGEGILNASLRNDFMKDPKEVKKGLFLTIRVELPKFGFSDFSAFLGETGFKKILPNMS
jgi:hypothetical protein